MRRSLISPLAVILAMCGVNASAHTTVPGLRVLSVDASGVTLEYRLGEYSLEPITTPEGPMSRVMISGFGLCSDEGKPALPVTGVWVALPPSGAVTLRILEQDTETRTDVDVAPADRGFVAHAGDAAGKSDREYPRDPAAYAASDPYPVSPAAIEGDSWLRFQRVAALRLYPARYIAASRTLLISRRLVLRVEFESSQLSASALEPAPAMDGSFEQIYAGAVLNYEQGRAYRARPKRAVRPSRVLSPLVTGNPEWRVRIDTTGVWRVRFDQLHARGWPDGIPVSAITASLRDTTVALAPTPWIENEISIDVIDANGDQIFDDPDFVVLPVRTWAERMSPTWYERRYGDAEIVWLSYKSAGSGLRVRTRPGWLNAASPAVPTSFPSTSHYERTLVYDAYPSDVTQIDQFLWTDPVADYQPIDLDADLLDLNGAGANITVRAQWVGQKNTQHLVSASWVNSGSGVTPLWTDQSFSGKGAFTHVQAFSASSASPGVNHFRISGHSPQQPVGSGASLNWFEVTYPRFYVARNNRLEFTNGASADTVELRVDGYVAATQPTVYAYDVTDWSDPARLVVGANQIVSQGGAWRLVLRDVVTAGAPRRYSAATDIPSVPDDAVTADVPSSLYLTPGQGVDMIIIVFDDWAAAVEPLASLRRSQGVSTLVAMAQDVYDEFNSGRKSHFAIRRFLRYALSHWNTRAVLLVGDASEDPQGLLGTGGPDFVPVPVIPSPVAVTDGLSGVNEIVPSDNWYVFGLTGQTGPGDALLGDMLIGRWTAGSASEVQNVVDKVIAYENPAMGGAWRARAVLIADDTYATAGSFGGGAPIYCPNPVGYAAFQNISQDVEAIIHQEGGYSNYDVGPFYLAEYLSGLQLVPGCGGETRLSLIQTQQYTRAAVTPLLLQELSVGAGFVDFEGFGNASGLTQEDLYLSRGPEQDIDLVSNSGRPWVFTGFASHLNSFARIGEGDPQVGDGLGERMVNAAGRGAVASFASTANELIPSDPPNSLSENVYRAIFSNPPPGDSTGPGSTRLALGGALALGVFRMVASASFPERGAARTYELLGDPLLGLSLSHTVDVPAASRSILSPILEPGRPNPASGGTRFSFSLPVAEPRARLALYDLEGRLVRVLLDKPLASGVHEALWDGRLEGGQAASSGVYFCRLELSSARGRQVLSRRIVHVH